MVDPFAPRRRATVVVGIAVAGAMAGPSAADIVCPDSSYVQVDYVCTFTGSYRTGEPKDIITVSPDGRGETFAENGISIRVYLRNCQGEPVVGVPKESIALTYWSLCVSPGGNFADGPTDSQRMTTFSGTLRAGGCTIGDLDTALDLEVDGVKIATVPVKTNSPDDFFAWPCVVGSDEVAKLAGQLRLSLYSRCFDFNEDGVLDAVDWGIRTTRYFDNNCLYPPPPSGKESER